MKSMIFAKYFAGTIANAAIALAGTYLMTSYVSAEGMGRVGLFLSLMVFIGPLVSFQVEGLVPVAKLQQTASDFSALKQTAHQLALILAVLLSAAICLARLWYELDWIFMLMPAYALSRFVVSFSLAEYVASGRAGTHLSASILVPGLSWLVSWLLFHSVEGAPVFRILSVIAVDVGWVYLSRDRNRSQIKNHINVRALRQIFNFGFPLLLALPGAWLLNESDKILIKTNLGTSVLGQYTVFAGVAVLLMTFLQSLTVAMIKPYYETLNGKDLNGQQRIVLSYVRIFVLLTSLVAAAFVLLFVNFGHLVIRGNFFDDVGVLYTFAVAHVAVAAYRPIGMFADYSRLSFERLIAVTTGGAFAFFTAWAILHFHGQYQLVPLAMGGGYLIAALSLYKMAIRRLRTGVCV